MTTIEIWLVDNYGTLRKCFLWTTSPHHNRFTALFPGPPGWAGARRELLDCMVQGKINTGRHTDHPAGRHSIRTKQCPASPSPHTLYRPDALPAAQPTVSKHWRQSVFCEALQICYYVKQDQPTHQLMHHLIVHKKFHIIYTQWHILY